MTIWSSRHEERQNNRGAQFGYGVVAAAGFAGPVFAPAVGTGAAFVPEPALMLIGGTVTFIVVPGFVGAAVVDIVGR